MVYTLYFIYLIVGAISNGNGRSKSYLPFAMLLLALIIGLRDTTVGVDTLGYVEEFGRYNSMDIDQVTTSLRESKEPLFVLGSWLVASIFNSSVVFTLFWGAFPCVALGLILRDNVQYAKGHLTALLVIFALGLFAFFMAGMRQTAAISIVMLAYYQLVKNGIEYKISFLKSRDFIRFLFLMFIAYNLHNSSILFFIVLPILKIKIRWWYLPIVIGLFFVGNVFEVSFLTSLAAYFFNDRFENYGTIYESSQSINAFIMQFILFMICFLRRDQLIKADSSNNYLFNVIMVGLVFQSFSGLIYEMARVSFYYSIFLAVLVPRAIEAYPTHIKKTMYVGFTTLVLFYLYFLSSSNLPEYHSVLF